MPPHRVLPRIDLKVPMPTPPSAPAPLGALWQLGFRPFYLLAATLALLSVPLWALQFSGLWHHGGLRGALWHAHEMVFGYALAVIIGFLFTAGRNWSGQPTPTGGALMSLAGLWVLARVLVLSPWLLASGLVNMAVPWLAAWGLWRALHAGGNRRNYFFVGLLITMGLATGTVHLSQMNWLTLPTGLGLPLALDIVLLMIAVMAGRVVPMFSNNGVPGLRATRNAHVEKAVIASIGLTAALDLAGILGLPLALVLGAGLVAHAWRWVLWRPWGTWRVPLVWVLHLSYLWLLIHLLLRALSTLGWAPAGPATHALTVGTIGMVTMGMITRTALGHTGRALRAGPFETGAYVALLASATVRVGLPLVAPPSLPVAAQLSAALWSLAFALYLWRYAPILTRPRADGQPG